MIAMGRPNDTYPMGGGQWHERTNELTKTPKPSVDSYGLVSPKARIATIHAVICQRVMPPWAHFYLILAAVKADDTGRTTYGPAQHENATGDPNGARAVEWLTEHGLMRDALTANGVECWQVTHVDYASLQGPSTPIPPDIAEVLTPVGEPYRPPKGGSWRDGGTA